MWARNSDSGGRDIVVGRAEMAFVENLVSRGRRSWRGWPPEGRGAISVLVVEDFGELIWKGDELATVVGGVVLILLDVGVLGW